MCREKHNNDAFSEVLRNSWRSLSFTLTSYVVTLIAFALYSENYSGIYLFIHSMYLYIFLWQETNILFSITIYIRLDFPILIRFFEKQRVIEESWQYISDDSRLLRFKCTTPTFLLRRDYYNFATLVFYGVRGPRAVRARIPS